MAKRPDQRPGSGASLATALREEIKRIRGQDNLGAAPTAAVIGHGAEAVSVAGTLGEVTDAMTEAPAGLIHQAANGPLTSSPTLRATIATSPTSPASESFHSVPIDATRPQSKSGASQSPSVSVPMASVAGTGGLTALIRSPLARQMLEVVLAEPVILSAEERYLHGHYLAYLLSGSRRRGLFLRRPLEPRNADRGRLLLGITYAILAGGGEDAIREAATLLDQRIEVRSILSPVVVAKYLSCRENPAKRKQFRQARKALGQASKYAQKRMTDAKGVLNPGLMPQRLEDLRLLAPVRDDVDDVLVERWNRVTEVWRNEVEFRTAVLRYATCKAHRDPASTALWPEVVYPLIERARWHRRIRPRAEAVWDYVCGRLHVRDAGVALDRALSRSVPAPLVAQIDDEMKLFADNAGLDSEMADPFGAAPTDASDRLTASLNASTVNLVELAAERDDPGKGVLPLVDPNPLRFSQGQLHELWKEAITAMQSQAARPGAKPASHRHVSVGPYRLIVIPSIRGRAAGQIAIQGMTNKQIELSTPTVRTKGSANKALLAVWVYQDNSLAIIHLDFMNTERYVLWHAPRGHQLKFDDAAELNHELYTLGMEIPDQLDKVLTRSFKPQTR